MKLVQKELYQFSTYIQPINLSFNQYLLLGKEPLLIHTGSHDLAVSILPGIKEMLGEKSLRYIFVSHFEGDECGGLGYLLEQFPEAKAVCSEITARQLMNFGITDKIMIKKPGETLTTPDYELDFIGYPSEMHLWEGLLAFEKRRGILFSSDLFLRFGKYSESERVDFKDEIQGITEQQVPDSTARVRLQEVLSKLPIQTVATGHGPYLEGK